MPTQTMRNGRRPPPDYTAGSGIPRIHLPGEANGLAHHHDTHNSRDMEPSFSSPAASPPPPARPTQLSKEECHRIIKSEFRGVQLSQQESTKSVFDLIDTCSALFEESKELCSVPEGLQKYIRAYLLFNYFINTYIMHTFGGFNSFQEEAPQDFIIYLNLYNFFRTDDIIGQHVFGIELNTLQRYIDEYLISHDLIKFNHKELFAWLNEYIEYLKHKDDESEEESECGSDQGIEPVTPEVSKPYYQTEPTNSHNLAGIMRQGDAPDFDDDDMFEFANRFPEVSAESKTPYPVQHVQSPLTEPSLHPDRRSDPPKWTSLSASPPTRNYKSNGILREPPNPLSAPSHSKPPPPSPPQVPPVPITYRKIPPDPPKHNAPLYAMRSQEQLPYGPSTQSLPVVDPSMVYSNNGNAFYYSNRSQDQLQVSQPQRHYQTVPTNYQQLSPYNRNTSYRNGPPQQYVRQQPMNVYGNGPIQYYGPMSNPHKAYTTASTSVMDVQRAREHERMQKAEWLRSLSICGLKNLGSSCYINSTVQVMFGVHRFVSLFAKRSSNAQLAKAMSLSSKPTPLTEALVGLLSTFRSSGGAIIAPTKFIRIVSSLKPSFNIPFEQQDAQEFLLFMLEKLHEELSSPPSEEMLETDYVRRWGVDVSAKEKDEYLKWYRDLMKAEGVSPISDLCQGHVRSQLICDKCGCTSNSYSSFSMLSLPIPNTARPVVDLIDCLRYYTQDERLSGDNAWKCPRCNKIDGDGNPMDVVFQPKRSLKPWKNKSSKKAKESSNGVSSASIKKLSIIKLPQVLFIHLSRFSMFSLTDKLNNDISYPLRLKFNNKAGDVSYNLTGLINHFGNLKSGHYTSLVNKAKDGPDRLINPEWCYLDDENFRLQVPHGDVNSEHASKVHSRDVYVLCYERSY